METEIPRIRPQENRADNQNDSLLVPKIYVVEESGSAGGTNQTTSQKNSMFKIRNPFAFKLKTLFSRKPKSNRPSENPKVSNNKRKKYFKIAGFVGLVLLVLLIVF